MYKLVLCSRGGFWFWFIQDWNKRFSPTLAEHFGKQDTVRQAIKEALTVVSREEILFTEIDRTFD